MPWFVRLTPMADYAQWLTIENEASDLNMVLIRRYG